MMDLTSSWKSVERPEGDLSLIIRLDLSDKNLKELSEWIFECKNLQVLYCHNNQLTSLPDAIGSLKNLQELSCSNNQLEVLPDAIGSLTNLQKLYCDNNQLKVLPASIGALTNLQYLSCNNNQLKGLPEAIGALTNLKSLYCSNNQLKVLPDAIGFYESLTNLQYLSCCGNQLKGLPDAIGLLTNLQYLYCNNNQLTKIPLQIMQCRNLSNFTYDGNPIENIPPILTRWLNRLQNRLQNMNRQGLHLYNDSQSVHNRNIQESIRESIYKVLSDGGTAGTAGALRFTYDEITTQIVEDQVLTDQTKKALIEYSTDDDTEMSLIGCTFKDLLVPVWNRIQSHSESEQLKRILNTEISDGMCKCFTGRISRLLNVLTGFYDDVNVTIHSSEQIGNIIVITKEKLESEARYSIELHKEIVRKELIERGYPEDTIEEWLNEISDD